MPNKEQVRNPPQKKDLAIHRYTDRKEYELGFVETDLVSHDGSLAKGDHAWSLMSVDFCLPWTEPVPLRNLNFNLIHFLLVIFYGSVPGRNS